MNAPAMTRTVRISAPQTTTSRRRELFVTDGSGTYGRFGFDPGVEIFLRQHLEVSAHAVVAIAAELRALNLVSIGARRDEMHRNAVARRGILGHAYRNDFERVNDVERGDVRDHGLVHRHGDLGAVEEDVVLDGGIASVE